jgi:hypothetical protein
MSKGKVQLENVVGGCYACMKFFIGDIRCPLTPGGASGYNPCLQISNREREIDGTRRAGHKTSKWKNMIRPANPRYEGSKFNGKKIQERKKAFPWKGNILFPRY